MRRGVEKSLDAARTPAQCHLVLKVLPLSKTFNKSYVLDMTSSAIFNLYVQLAPAELFRLVQQEVRVVVRTGIYSARVVIWMMMNQRLQPRGTLASSVEQLAQ